VQWARFLVVNLDCCAAILVVRPRVRTGEAAAAKKSGSSGGGIADAYRFNTLGVAYMNQQRPADAQKYLNKPSRLTQNLPWPG